MENNDLFNINKDEKKSSKTLLLIAGALFTVFVLVVVIIQFINAEQNENTKVIIPPEIKENGKLFNEVEVIDEKETTQEEFKKPELKEEVETKQEEKVEVTPLKKEEKVEPKPEVKKEVVTQEKEKKSEKVTKGPHYYIQVAALVKSKEPSKKFLNLIKKEGFNYEIKEETLVKNGKTLPIKRILIGPYQTKSEARKEIKKVKAKISSGAFFKVYQ